MKKTLRRFNLTLSEIAQRIRTTVFDRPLGDFGTEVTRQARIDASVDYAEALANVMIVPSPTGGGIYLNDLATLSNDIDRTQEQAFIADQHAIVLIHRTRTNGQCP